MLYRNDKPLITLTHIMPKILLIIMILRIDYRLVKARI